MENTRVIKILCLCSSMVAWFLGFSLKKKKIWEEELYKKEKMKAYEGLKWSSLFGFNGYAHEFIGPQRNNIILINWGQIMN